MGQEKTECASEKYTDEWQMPHEFMISQSGRPLIASLLNPVTITCLNEPPYRHDRTIHSDTYYSTAAKNRNRG